jgi:hypothetical protein
MSGKNFQNLLNATLDWNNIEAAALMTGTDPDIIAAMGIRESGYENVIGDNGHGYGIFQFDNRYNSPNDLYVAMTFPNVAAEMVGNRLATSYTHNSNLGASPDVALAGAVRAYNAGQPSTSQFMSNVPGYVDLDIGTANNDYVSQVLAIAQNCFH